LEAVTAVTRALPPVTRAPQSQANACNGSQGEAPENQPSYKVTAVTASKVKDRKEGPRAIDYRPSEVLRLAREAGVTADVEGARVVLRAARQPPDDVLALLKEHKAELVAMLRPDAALVCAQCGAGPSTVPPSDAPAIKVTKGTTIEWLHPECADFRRRYGKPRS